MKLNYPKVCVQKDGIVYVHFHIESVRYRLFNGKRLGINLDPNSFPIHKRPEIAKLLCAEVYKHLSNGGLLKQFKKDNVICGKLTDKEYLYAALEQKRKGEYALRYKKGLESYLGLLMRHCRGSQVTHKEVLSLLNNYSSNTSKNTVLRHLKTLISEAKSIGLENNPLEGIKYFKSKAKLHKPISNVSKLINEVTAFNDNLGLCCLITYGCLLRPHREVRELTWGDFSEDLKQINLSGARNKSGRNRIVPVPYYVQERLSKGEPQHNIFSGTDKPFADGYFKTLWRRFKKVSKLLEQDQTLYSFRHSGAIEIYKRTGSLSKLQKAMGHSSLAVSLTYLRGLEVAELEEDDMPMI